MLNEETSAEDQLAEVYDAYEALGFNRAVIAQWSIPVQDAVDLVGLLRARQPKRVLEVGTFVGVSTSLIGLNLPADGRVVSIDPNFPLHVEMSSMGSDMGSVDPNTRTHDLARAAAERLGWNQRGAFQAGGFSSGGSFASRRTGTSAGLPLVGQQVCEREGPFDLIFIDGLHYADVVASDLELAHRWLAPGGVILMHDAIGMWGRNVRTGIYRFLDAHPDWGLRHAPYHDLYRSIGLVARANEIGDGAAGDVNPGEQGVTPAMSAHVIAPLVTALRTRFQPERVLEIADEAGAISGGCADATTSIASVDAAAIASALDPGVLDGVQLVVGGPGIDALARSQLKHLFKTLVAQRTILVALRTPPGEAHVAPLASCPLQSWVDLAGEVGAGVYQVSDLDVSASRFLVTKDRAHLPNTAAATELVAVAAPDTLAALPDQGRDVLHLLTAASAQTYEQDVLEWVHESAAFDQILQELAVAQQTNEDLRRQLRDVSVHATLGVNPDSLVESALARARERGENDICLMMPWEVSDGDLQNILAEDVVASVGARVDSAESEGESGERHGRIGVYRPNRTWLLPHPCKSIYFLGPWRDVSVSMLRDAARTDSERLYARFARRWVGIPLRKLRALKPVLRSLVRFQGRVRNQVARVVPGSLVSYDDAFQTLTRDAQVAQDHVPGRVLVVCGNLSPGGCERQVTYTLRGLADRPLESVRLLCHHLQPGPDRHDFYLPHVRAAGVKVREINRRIADPQDAEVPEPLRQVAGALPASLLCDIANLVHEIRTLKPEVVHAFLDWDNVRAGLAAAIVGVPRIVLSGRNLNPSHFDLYQPYMDPAYRALVDLPNVHITNNSAAGAADYADWIGIARERIGVIYNAVDFPPEARPDAAVVENRKALLGLSEPGPVVGGAFRFCSEKRPLLWLEVARRVSAAVPDARFVIHGDGPLLDAMRKCAQRLGLEDRLVLPGVSDDILPSMAAMDVFLLTSEGEGIPNVLLEAQTVGTPVVATDAGGAAEAVENGITGHVLDTQDPKDLAQAVLTFLQDETAAARAASRGPELMRERFGFHQMVDATLEAYGYNLAPRSVSAAI